MCKNKTELYKITKEYKALLKQKAEIEARLNELKEDIVPYVVEHGVPNAKSSNSCLTCYSRGMKISYIACTRSDPDRDKLKAFLGDSYNMYLKYTDYHTLKVS
jgi:hypothetical protein